MCHRTYALSVLLVTFLVIAAAHAQTPKPAEPSPQITTNSIGMRLVLIPAGEFLMGSGESDQEMSAYFNRAYPPKSPTADSNDQDSQTRAEIIRKFASAEKPQHRVRITRPFYLGQYEVTVAQFSKFVADSGYQTDAQRNVQFEGAQGFNAQTGKSEKGKDYSWRKTGFAQTDDHPVVNVTWNDAVAFCQWLSRKEGQACRLPTEAEWEYACRARTTTRYYSGDDPQSLAQAANVRDSAAQSILGQRDDAAAHSDGHVFTAPVGAFRPNAFGLYDMHGNVWEWCADWYKSDYYATSPSDDPPGPADGTSRIARGGGWSDGIWGSRSTIRYAGTPLGRQTAIGFRVAQDPPASQTR